MRITTLLVLLFIPFVLGGCDEEARCEDFDVQYSCDGDELVVIETRYGADCSNNNPTTTEERTVCEHGCIESNGGTECLESGAPDAGFDAGTDAGG